MGLQSELSAMFPNEDYKATLDLLRKAKRLLPIGDSNSFQLEIIISYVEALINGDELHREFNYQFLSESAKAALTDIQSEVQKRTLDSYRCEYHTLKDEVTSLLEKKETLEKNLTSLEQVKDRLLRQAQDLDADILIKKEKLTSEVTALADEKRAISEAISELKSKINEYSQIVENSGSKSQVVLETISEDHPLLKVTSASIDYYLESLISEYIRKTGKSRDEAIVFFTNLGLFSIKELISSFVSSVTLKYIIERPNDFDFSYADAALSLKYTMENFKMPVYKEASYNIDSFSVKPGTVPNNINSLLRELHFQRIAMEAVAKQRILESQVEALTAILMSATPEGYDFSTLAQEYQLETFTSKNKKKLLEP